MALVLGNTQISAAMKEAGLKVPFVVQEFRNHGGQLAKVYVAGDKVRTRQHPVHT